MSQPAGSRPRLVLDTNVFISALISDAGAPAKILRAIQRDRVIHLVSDPIVAEYLRVLEYPRIRKFKMITEEFIAGIAAYLINETERVELTTTVKLSPDPDDGVFLSTAIDGKATLLVSGDKTDLLALGAVRHIPIVSSRQALAKLDL